MSRFSKCVALSIICTLLSTASLTISHAAVKQGAACKKLNQTQLIFGVTFKCIKSGKKLIWRAEKKSNASENQEKTSEKISQSFKEYWKSMNPESLAVWEIIKPVPSDLKGAGSPDITYAFSSDIPLDSQEEIKRQYRYTTTYWARFTPINQRLHVAVSKLGDSRFLCTERAKYIQTGIDGCVQYNPGPWVGAYTMFDDGSGTFNWMTINPELRLFDKHEKWTSHHEYVHSVQYSLNRLHWQTQPCWFEEGMAMLFSAALASEGKFAEFLKLRNPQAGAMVGPSSFSASATASQWSDWVKRATVPKYGPSNQGADGCEPFRGSSPDTGIYEVGLLGVEKIILKVGMSGLFKLITLTGANGWESAVKDVTGKTTDELNMEIGQYIQRENLSARKIEPIYEFCRANPKDVDCG
jgi:hypothetical protein